jgi:hypothetical protein
MITFKRVLASARLFSQMQSGPVASYPPLMGLTQSCKFGFAFMSLFENNKKPAELDPAFKRKTKLKGHIKFKKNSGVVSPKLNTKVREQKSKLANHKGLLKRIKIVV